jgi:hypothetical protein
MYVEKSSFNQSDRAFFRTKEAIKIIAAKIKRT